jgi:hypothetical protein
MTTPLDPGIDAMIEGAAAQYNVAPNFLRATILQESGGNPSVPDSSAGAKGIAQFLPATLREVMGPEADPYDVPTAIAGAAKYLAQGLSEGERLGISDPGVYAARYYNGGPRGPGLAATEGYAQQVASRYAALEANSAPSAGAAAANGGAASPAVPVQSAPNVPSGGGGSSLPQPPTDADLALLDPSLSPLARLGLMTPEQQEAALAAPVQQLARVGTGGTPGNGGGLPSGGALLVQPGPPAAPPPSGVPGPTAAADGLVRLASAGVSDVGPSTASPSAPPLAPNQYPQTPQQFNSTMVRDVTANARAPQSSVVPVSSPVAPPVQSPAPAASASPAAAAAAGAPDVSKMSDDEFVKAIAAGKIPPPGGQATSAAGSQPASGDGATQGGAAGNAAIGVQQMVDDYNFYSSFPAGLPMAQQVYKGLQDASPQGFQLNKDGTLSVRPGFAQGTAEVAGAKAKAEQEQARITAAVAPQRTRAGEGVVYPPGSPLAPGGSLSPLPAPGTTSPPPAGTAAAVGGGAATPSGGAPGVLTATAGGGASIAGTPPPQSTETFYKRFEQLGDAADAARSGLQLADQLQDRLRALPSTGPLAPGKGELSAALSQFGVTPQQLQSFGLPAPGATESADKLSIDLLSDILHRTFPGGRITNADIQTMMPTVARAATPMAANDYLINSVLKPRLQRDVDRYTAVVDLPQNDPTLASLPSKLNQWDLNPQNTYASYLKRAQAASTAAPGGPGEAVTPAPGTAVPAAGGAAAPPRRLRFDPTSNALVPQ